MSLLGRASHAARAVLLAWAVCLGIGIAAAEAPTADPRFVRSVQGGAVAPWAQGRWNLPGYGMLFDFRATTADVYDRAGDLCWRDTEHEGMPAVEDLVPFVAAPPAQASALFASSPDGTWYRADSLATIPAACAKAESSASPAYVFHAITASLIELYPFAREHHVDWAARAARLQSRAASARSAHELQAILAELFQGVEDPHTSIAGTLDGKPFRIRSFRGQDYKALQYAFWQQDHYALFLTWLFEAWMPGEFDQASAALLPGTRHEALGRRVVWGRLKSDVGYLAINAMWGFEPDSDVARDRVLLRPVLDQALAELKDTRALVLDISHNLGGDDAIAADIAARFADKRRPAYSKRAFRGGLVQRFDMKPYDGIRYLKPVYLLTSELTASAAEVFAMRMRELPNVVQVGEPTQGVFSDATEKGLPNGWILSMSTEIYLDAQGRSHEGVGLLPAVPYRVIGTAHAGSGYRDAILRAGALGARQETATRELAAHPPSG